MAAASKLGRVSLAFLFLHTLFSHSVFAQDDVNPVPPIQEVKTEDAISTPLTDGCPQECSAVGYDTAKWTQVHSYSELARCDLPLLFGLNVANTPSEFSTIQTCVVQSSVSKTKRDETSAVEPRAAEGSISVDNNCGAEKATVKAALTSGPSGAVGAVDAAASVELLAQYLDQEATCGSTTLFAKSGSVVVGLFVGAEVQKGSASSLLLGQFR